MFFDSKECAVEVRARVIYGEGEGDIITQYVMFCKVLKEQVKLHGMTRKALRETIRLCKDLGVLREYLEKREVEVMDIMTMLFDQETVTNTYINDVLRQGRAEGRAEGEAKGRAEGRAEGELLERRATACAMLREGMPPDLISHFTRLSLEELQSLAAQESSRSEERRVGKECRSRWSPYH